MTQDFRASPTDSAPNKLGLGERTVGATRWRITSGIVQLLVAFPIGIVLARLLVPADFGLAALSLIVVGLVTLAADLGLGAAIIQRAELSERHLRVALTAALLLGLVIAGLVVAAAPLIGLVARADTLPAVLRLQSFVFITSGGDTVARAILQRRLDFRRLYVVDVASQLLGTGLVSLACAFAGMGVWSLVFGNLARGVISCSLTMKAAKLPLKPLLTRHELHELLDFGVRVSANGMVNYVARSGDNFIVGRMLGTAALGVYARAFNLMMMPLNYVTGAFFATLVPAFAELQNQRRRMGRGFLLSVQLSAIVVAPIAGVMMVAAPHLILGLYGEQWATAIRPLQVLCLIAVPTAVTSLTGPVNRACNRVVTELKFQCTFATAVVGTSIVGAHYGIVAVAALVGFVTILMYVAMCSLALSATMGTWREIISAQVPGTLIGLFAIVVALLVRFALERSQWSHFSIFLALVIGGAISVPLGVYALPASVRPLDLFNRLTTIAKKLPAPLRVSVVFAMHTANDGA